MHKISLTVKDLDGFSFSIDGATKKVAFTDNTEYDSEGNVIGGDYFDFASAALNMSVPSLCIKLNSEQCTANCPVCGSSNTFDQGPQIYVEGTNDIVCEPCLCHYDDEPGEPSPLQVAAKDIYILWYFTVGDWNRSHKQSK